MMCITKSSLLCLVISFKFINSVRFKGSCPVPHRSAEKLPDVLPDTLVLLSPLTSASSIDAPFFSKRNLATGQKCAVELKFKADSSSNPFTLANKESGNNATAHNCHSLNGILERNRDMVSYNLNYQMLGVGGGNSSTNLPECTKDWEYSNHVFVYTESKLLIIWICINNRPETGASDEALTVFINGTGPLPREDDYLIPTMNQITFSKLTLRHFIRVSLKNCSTNDDIFCPPVNCPSPREDLRKNALLVIWLACFGVVSLVSSSFCGLALWNRRTSKRTGQSKKPVKIQVQPWDE